MRRALFTLFLAAIGVGSFGTGAQAVSSTRTNVCKAGFCADVTRERTTQPQQIFTTVSVRSNPDGSVNMRCPTGQQIEGYYLMCAGRSVAVQACRRKTFGRSTCTPWVVFQ